VPGPNDVAAQLNALLKLSDGTRFRKVDLHVHTPASSDMHGSWKSSTPADVVRIAQDAKLDAIAITDHNSVAWCESVLLAAQDGPLVVFPGVEISTSEGHLLAIFDPSKPIEEIRDLLVRLGVDTSQEGRLDVLADGRLDDVAEQVSKHDGIAIAAHVEGEKGFWRMTEATGVRRQQIFNNEYIIGLEIVHSDVREESFAGTLAGYERRIACVQGSDCWHPGKDAHHLDAMGNRHCFVRMDDVSLDGLKQALLDPELCVRLVNDDRPAPRASIEAVTVAGGFLNDLRARLNPHINCFIGGTGSGKSLTLELTRFALDQQVDGGILEKIANETQGLVAFGLGDSATVRIVVRKDLDFYVVERSWLKDQTLPPVVYRLEDDLSRVDQVHVPSFFPIKAFSQGEIIEYAREPLARLSLLDDLLDLKHERAAIENTKGELRKNATEWIETRRRLEKARGHLSELSGLLEQIAQLEKFVQDPRIQEHDAWYVERDLLNDAREQLEMFSTAIEESFPTAAAPENPDPSPNSDLFVELGTVFEELRKRTATSQDDIMAAARGALASIADIRSRWDGRFDVEERTYQELIAQLDEDGLGLGALTERLTGLKQQERRLRAIEQEVAKELLPRGQAIEEEREGLLTQLGSSRTSIRDKRRTKAAELGERLQGRVRISVRAEANGRVHRGALLELRHGSRIREADVDRMVETLHPIPFVKSLLHEDFQALSNLSGLDEAVFRRLLNEGILDKDRLDDLLEFQLTDREDIVRIQFDVQGGEYRDLEALAHGQKCTVVLMVALAEGTAPLLVDQPEDALHAPWIEENIVTTLRADRGRRQCIFATRSANVLVSADSEQIIAMSSQSDKGWIDQTGGLDRFDTRRLVIYHVEGGPEAFARRRSKYGLGA